MESYNKKLYKFITKEEHFELAYEIHGQFYDVLNQLAEDFWKAVEVYVKSELNRNFAVRVDLDNELMMFVYKRGWEFSVVYSELLEKPNIGLYIHYDRITRKRQRELRKELTDESLLNKLDLEMTNDDEYVAKHNLREDFDSLSFLKRILPENRKEMVQVFGDRIIKRVKQLERTFK